MIYSFSIQHEGCISSLFYDRIIGGDEKSKAKRVTLAVL